MCTQKGFSQIILNFAEQVDQGWVKAGIRVKLLPNVTQTIKVSIEICSEPCNVE